MFFKNIDGDTAGVSCVFTPGANETCDDGEDNGKYGKTTSGKSHCRNDCTGRIAGGTEYFCDDGFVQYKSNETCTGVNCKEISADNYPGATIDDAPSEKCDTADSNTRAALCNRALNKTSTPASGYYSYTATSSSPSCASDCLSINDSTDTTGCNYCGDGVKADSETCEPGESSATICSRETGSYYGSPAVKTWDFEAATSPYGKPAEITEAINAYYDVDYGGDKCINTIYFDYMNKTSKERRCYSALTLTSKGSGWTRENFGGHNALCSANKGDNYSMTELKLTIKTSETGTISFNYYGGSEGANHCSGGYADNTFDDGMLVYFDKTPATGTNGGRNADLMAVGNCASWNTFSKANVAAGEHTLIIRYLKDSGTDKNSDKFCIDDLQFKGVGPATSQTDNPSNKTCNSNCTLGSGKCYSGWCGDSTTQRDSGEVCDSGPSNTDIYGTSGRCNKTCTGYAPHCGDGIKNGSEACDGSSYPSYCYTKHYSTDCDGNIDGYYFYIWYTTGCNSSCTVNRDTSYGTITSYSTNSTYTSFPSGMTSNYGQVQCGN